ncbi:MAG: TIGR01777 family oxidoreductase [Bacteroidia bacterium]|nr:TIGR01777 family oxidoreductase [Bacteroidia bacterium]
MKVVIAGGTGFIGRYLVDRYLQMGKQVYVVTRNPSKVDLGVGVGWNSTELNAVINESELLINLAGKSVDCRYTKANKAAIYRSRLETTQLLGEVIKKCGKPPELWINSSTATIYRDARDRPMDERTGELGTGFSVDVATQWEKTFFEFNLPKTRQVALRTAIVLGKTGGALPEYQRLALRGVGGKHGDGQQRISFVHIHDVFEAIQFIRDRHQLEGVFNVSAPTSATNEEFLKQVRKCLDIRVGLPIPKTVLEVGAFLLGTETELLLKSRWVFPKRLTDLGFQFRYPTSQEALRALLQETG